MLSTRGCIAHTARGRPQSRRRGELRSESAMVLLRSVPRKPLVRRTMVKMQQRPPPFGELWGSMSRRPQQRGNHNARSLHRPCACASLLPRRCCLWLAYPSRTVKVSAVRVRRWARLRRWPHPFHRTTHSRECQDTVLRRSFLYQRQVQVLQVHRVLADVGGSKATSAPSPIQSPRSVRCGVRATWICSAGMLSRRK